MDDVNNTLIECNYDTWNDFVYNVPMHQNSLLILHVNIRSMIKNFDRSNIIIIQEYKIQ